MKRHDQNRKIHTVKVIAQVETKWGVVYNVYIDDENRYWYDLDDDGINVEKAQAEIKEGAIKELEDYLKSIEDEYF